VAAGDEHYYLPADIAENPVTSDGKKDHSGFLRLELPGRDLWFVRHVVNGKARMACSALVDKLEQPIALNHFRNFR